MHLTGPLAFSVTLPQFAPFSVEHRPAQTMPAFTAIELGQRCAAPIFIIYVSQTMQSFVNSAEFCQGLGQPGWSIAHLESAHNAGCWHPPSLSEPAKRNKSSQCAAIN
jgi:hypothetical protein